MTTTEAVSPQRRCVGVCLGTTMSWSTRPSRLGSTPRCAVGSRRFGSLTSHWRCPMLTSGEGTTSPSLVDGAVGAAEQPVPQGRDEER
jgi:hypothetical protein